MSLSPINPTWYWNGCSSSAHYTSHTENVKLMKNVMYWITLSRPWPLPRTTLLLNVSHPKGSPTCTNHRLIWCPYIGDADDSSAANTTNTTDSLSTCDFNKMLVLTHDNTVLNVCNYSILCSKHIFHLLQDFLFWQSCAIVILSCFEST